MRISLASASSCSGVVLVNLFASFAEEQLFCEQRETQQQCGTDVYTVTRRLSRDTARTVLRAVPMPPYRTPHRTDHLVPYAVP